jgi:hypothetical protein
VKSNILKTNTNDTLEIGKHVYTDIEFEILSIWSCTITKIKDSTYRKVILQPAMTLLACLVGDIHAINFNSFHMFLFVQCS